MTREELTHKTKNEIIDLLLRQKDESDQKIAELTQAVADLKETIEELMPWSDKMKQVCAINDKPVIGNAKK